MSYVFVTVGSTSFESLVQNIDNKRVLSTLKSLVYTKIIYQIGSGKYVPSVTHILPVECFKLKNFVMVIQLILVLKFYEKF